MGRIRRTASLLLALGFALVPPAQASELAPEVEWVGTINGRNVDEVTPGEALQLSPAGFATIKVEVNNNGPDTLEIERVRLEGRILGLPFLVYTTDVNMVVSSGDSDAREFPLNLRDLDGQATGSILSSLILLDSNNDSVGSKSFAVEIDGSLRSVYGTFGLTVAGLTLLLLIGALWRLASGRLSSNRWSRAMTFAAPGLGVGFVLTFTLSALNLVVPTPRAWSLMLLFGGVIGFILGYLTPTPPGARHVADDPDWRYATDEGDVSEARGASADSEDVQATGRRRAENASRHQQTSA